MKAQGISINTIVITAIALIVLVVVATILVSQTGVFSRTIQSCGDIGGACKDRTSQPLLGCENQLDGFHQPSNTAVCLQAGTKDIDRSKVCCMPGSIQVE